MEKMLSLLARLSDTTRPMVWPASRRPKRMKSTLPRTSISRPFQAPRRAPSGLRSPRRRDSRLLIPVPMPVESAIISIWKGMARETAVRPLGSKRETKMLSTMLYSAWISMENIIGIDTLGTRRDIGMVPRSLERS